MFIFVGERPSKRAIEIGATWQNGKLAGKTLRDALVAIGINPDQQTYFNLFDQQGCVTITVNYLRQAQQQGSPIVGMGQVVCQMLEELKIPHIKIIHPAARGAIRKTEKYQAHLKERLLGNVQTV